MAEAMSSDYMLKRSLCRYFMQGVCRRGALCQFSHDFKDQPSMTCTFYQKGNCSYGDRCRYDHVKRDTNHSTSPTRSESKSNENGSKTKSSHNARSDNMFVLKRGKSPEKPKSQISAEKWVQAAEFIPGKAWNGNSPKSYSGATQKGLEGQEESLVITTEIPDDQVHLAEELCPFAAHNECPYGETCQYMHGEICDICGRAVLVPGDIAQNEDHRKACLKVIEDDMELSFTIAQSKDKACGICMETVLEKTPNHEQKFGILSNCNHVFCLSCIRTWRQAKQFENKIVRACPECRVKSDFVTPSKYWVEDKDKKQQLIEGYKSALSKKPCKYFDEGRGECPFNAICFYRHAYPDGRLASPKPRPKRQRQDESGEISIIDRLNLWDFFEEYEEDRRSMLVEDIFVQLSLYGYLPDSEEEDISDDEDVDMTDLF